MRKIQTRPEFVLGELLISLTPEALAEYEAGTWTGLDGLNEIYPLEEMDRIGTISAAFSLVFVLEYNARALAPIYEANEDIEYAEVNSIGGDGPDITRNTPQDYTFHLAWGDCPAGCTFEHRWTFRVIGGEVSMESSTGDPPPSASSVNVDLPSGRHYALGNPFPNPFNPSTRFTYRLENSGVVELRVVNARGQLVRRLLQGFHEPGAYQIRWNGMDDAGRAVASGTYWATLRVDGGIWDQRSVVLVK